MDTFDEFGEFRQNLRKWRIRRGLTQIELGKLASIGRDSISQLETGVHLPKPSTIRALARALDIETNDLFEERSPVETSARLDNLDVASLLQLNKSITDALLVAREGEDQERVDKLYGELQGVLAALNRLGPFTLTETSEKRLRKAKAKAMDTQEPTADAG